MMNLVVVSELVKKELGDVALDFRAIKKNGGALAGVVITAQHSSTSPIIYYDPCAADEAIAATIIKAYKSLPAMTFDTSAIASRDFILDHVIPCVYKKDGNEDFLDGLEQRDFLDLAITYRVFIDEDASYLIQESLTDAAGIGIDELHAAALDNLRKIAEVVPIQDILRTARIPCGDDVKILVLTTTKRTHAAATILLPEVLSACAERLDNDFYIIPSSVHECLAIPAKDVESAAIASMIQEVNTEHVDQHERLNNHPYKWDAKNKRLCLS